MLRRLLMPDCLVCGVEAGDPICEGCERDWFASDPLRCECCADRLDPLGRVAAPVCMRCLVHPPRYDATIALADYAPPVDGMVIALKFHSRLEIGHAFGRLLAARAPAQAFDAIVPIPLSRARLRERGFNQVEEIARSLAKRVARPILRNALTRPFDRPPQQGLGAGKRRANVRNAFAAPGRLDLAHVLLVDDVMTSGSTLDEAASILKRAGVRRVTNMVVARTP